MPISQIASMMESFFALFLVVILVSLVLSVKSQRLTDELNAAIKNLEEQATEMESYIISEYKLSNIDDAMAALQKVRSVFTDWIYKITESIR